MSNLTKQTQAAQAVQQQQGDLVAETTRIILGTKNAVSAALANRIDPDQFLRAVATDLRKTPHLAECLPETILGGMFTAAQMGLEIGSHRGHAYLVPYRNKKTGDYEASLIFGYKGFVELFYRAGARAVQWFLVREGDQFRIGSDARIGKTYEWIQADPNSTRRVTGTVAQVVTPTGGVVWEYLSAADVAKRATDTPFWKRWPDEMTLKTGLRRLTASAPASTDLRRALEVDETVFRQIPGEEQPVPRRLPDAAPAAIAARPAQQEQRQTATVADDRPKPHPPAIRTPPQVPADPPPADPEAGPGGEISEEEWARIEQQQYEDAMREQEEGR